MRAPVASLRLGRILRLLILALGFLAAKGEGAAAQWKASPLSYGPFHGAAASASLPGLNVELFCEMVRPDATEAELATHGMATEPGRLSFMMTAAPFHAEPFDGQQIPIDLAIDGQTWRAAFSLVRSEEVVRLSVGYDDSLVAALRNGSVLSVATLQGWRRIPLSGSRAAIDFVLATCRALEAPGGGATGSVAPGAGTAPGLSADWLLARAAAACAEFGSAPPEIEPGFLRQTEIDGDGAPDFLVDWSKLTCGGAGFSLSDRQGAGSCAALGCGLDVWASSLGTARPAASTQGFRFAPVTTDGRTELYVIGNGLPCAAPAEEFACATRWSWSGGALLPTGEPVTLAAFRRLTG